MDNIEKVKARVLSSTRLQASVPPVTSFAVAAAAGAATMVATYAPAVPATDGWLLKATRPLSAGKASTEQDYKIIETILTANASPLNIKSAYEAVFGTSWKLAGKKIFFTITPIELTSGIPATKSFSNSVVAA